MRSFATFLKFCIVGSTSIIANRSVLSLLLTLEVNKFIASPMAIQASNITNFLLNNYWTFRWCENRDPVRIKGLKFNIVSFIPLLVGYGTFVSLTLRFPDTAPQIHQLIGVVPAVLVNYF